MDIEAVDPELRPAMQKLPQTDPGKAGTRRMMRLATRLMPVPRDPKVRVESRKAGGARVRIYRPDAPTDRALLWIHGGGLLFGDAKQDEALCLQTSAELGITVVSANYRFAPEHPFPAPLDDVRAAWLWLQESAGELGVDPARIAVGGESAGGGLAAGLVQRLRDTSSVQPVAQWLFAPMIDDRTAADESLDAADHWVWNNRANRIGWAGYLGGSPGAAVVPAYASPARRTELTGLPPTWIGVGDIELFLDEDLAYAEALRASGVDVTVDVVPGAPHGFENWARSTEPARALAARARAWLAARL